MSQDGLASFEPAYVDELAEIMRFAFEYVQRDGSGEPDERTWLRDETGGSIYMRLSTRAIEQPNRKMTPELAQGIVDGAYWLREPGPNAQVIVAYTGVIAPEAIEAVGLMAEDRRDVGLLAVTSADRLKCRLDGGAAGPRARPRGMPAAISSGFWPISRPIAASSPCSTATPPRWAGSAPFMAIARARSAWSISARPAPSPISSGITASTRKALSRLQK